MADNVENIEPQRSFEEAQQHLEENRPQGML